MSDISLLFNLIGKDNVSKAFGSANGSMAKLAKGVAIGGAAIVAAAAGAGAALFAIGDQFDGAYDKIRVTTGATGKELEALKQDFREVVKDVPADFATASTAIADLKQRTGATGPVLQNLAKQMLELSRITETDVATNTAAVTRVFGDWGIATGKQSGALDAMFRASQATGIGVSDLAETVVQFGAPLRQFGFSFEESIALLGKWEKEGVNTGVVLAGMKAGLGNFSKAGKEPVKALADITQKIKEAGSAGEANKIAIEAFGKRAGPDMAAAVREGRLELGDLLKTVQGGSDTILKAGAETMDFAEKWQMFKNNIMLKLEPIAMRVFDALGAMGSALEPAFAAAQAFVSGKLIPAIRDLAAWFMEHLYPAIRETGIFVKNVVVVAFELLRPVFLLIAGAALLIGKALINGVIPALKSTMQWMNQNKGVIKALLVIIGTLLIPHWIALGVAAMKSGIKQAAAWAMAKAGALKAAVMHSTQIAIMIAKWVALGVAAMAQAVIMAASWLIAFWPIALIIAAIIGLVALIVMNWDTIRNATVAAWNAVWKFVSDIITAVVNWIVARFNDVITFFKNIPGWITSALATVWDVLTWPFRTAFGWVSDRITDAVDWFKNLPGYIGDALGALWDAITAPFKAVFNWIKDRIEDLFGWVTDTIDAVKAAIGMANGAKVGKANGGSKKFGGGKAIGGPVKAGTTYLVGERGPELYTPNGNGTITPNSELAGNRPVSVGISAGSSTVVIQIDSAGARMDDVLVELLRKAIRVKGGNVQVVLGNG